MAGIPCGNLRPNGSAHANVMPQGAAGVGRKSGIFGDLVGDPDPEQNLDRFISAGYGFIDDLYVESLYIAHSWLSARPTSEPHTCQCCLSLTWRTHS